jgi:hypothetical protein
MVIASIAAMALYDMGVKKLLKIDSYEGMYEQN